MKCVIQLAGKIGITTLFSLCFELRNKSVDIVGSRNRKKQIEALTAGLQKVSAQIELNKSAPQTVLNER